MNEKLLKLLIYVFGGVCLYAFVATRYLPFFNAALKEPVVPYYWDKTKYGELYYFSMINHFKEEGLPPSQQKLEHSPKHATVQDCDILTFGDSFFEFSRHKQIPERFADDFNKQVHYVNNDFPLTYLAQNAYKDTTPKLVIFERVERYIPIAFQSEQLNNYKPEPPVSKAKSASTYIIEKIFYNKSEELFDAMLKRSYLSTDIYSLTSTIKFNLFGYITKLTPVYKVDKNESWLFYHDQVNEERTSFYYPFSDAQVDSICDHMASLAAKLKDEYNMTLVYLPVPAKYTIYHNIVNDDTYNNLLPRLYKGLDNRNVHYVNIFNEFSQSDTLLYYRTDSHWNQKGIDIAYNKTLEYIKSDSTLMKYIQ